MVNGDAAALLIWSSCFTIFGTATGSARLYVRFWILKSTRLDDLFLFLAMITGIAVLITIIIYAHRILSHWTTSTNEIRKSPLRFEAESFNQGLIGVFALQNTFARVSLALSYKRFTPDSVRHWAHIFMRVLLTLIVAVGLVTLILSTIPCWPPHILRNNPDFYQDIRNGKWKCLEPRLVFWWNGIVLIPLDLVIWVFPFVLLRGVNLSKKQRIGLYILFAFGGAVFIVSIFRMFFLLSFHEESVLTEGVNPLTEVSNIWVFTTVEANSILVAASVPTLRPLMRKIRGVMKGVTEDTNWSSTHNVSGSISRKGSSAPRAPGPAMEMETQRTVNDV